jgi:hypothetical protein
MAVDAEALFKMLVTIGYLPILPAKPGPTTARAVRRFQRHARRKYRVPAPDAAGAELFTGAATGVPDEATFAEARKWIERGWKLPVGRFQLRGLSAGGRLREDAALAWDQIVRLATTKGATLEGPYGDTARPVNPTSKVGASRYSFHYAGRAVDINQALGGGRSQRYYIAKEATGIGTFWRIYCKTAQQDGSQGTRYPAKQVKCFGFHNWQEYDLPVGYYVDLTALIESTSTFERIKAQTGWNGNYNKTEWWHFQYKVDKQPTFLDEMELIGYSEAKLRRCGWTTDDLLDHAPG